MSMRRRSQDITAHLQEQGVQHMNLPADSPDLNPIERMWDQLGRAVCRRVTDGTTLRNIRRILIVERYYADQGTAPHHEYE